MWIFKPRRDIHGRILGFRHQWMAFTMELRRRKVVANLQPDLSAYIKKLDRKEE